MAYSHADISFGDKDQEGEYTLLPGDIVEFSVATDRRDKLQRATKIVLLNETFDKTTERRETVNIKITKFLRFSFEARPKSRIQ